MITTINAKKVKAISYNLTTPASTAWSLAIPKNSLRQGWLIHNNATSGIIKVGIGDNVNNVTEITEIGAKTSVNQSLMVTTDNIFVSSAGGSAISVSATEFIN